MPCLRFNARRRWQKGVSLLLIASMLAGCSAPVEKPKYLGADRDLTAYEDQSLKLEHPVLDQEVETPASVAASDSPHTLGDTKKHDEIWEMPLAEAIHLALTNNRIVRTRGEFLSSGNQLYTNPDNITSVYDPAIRDSGVLFGTRGVESALAAFDTQFTTRLLWNENKQVQNSLFALNGLTPGTVLDTDGATFNTGLTKQFAYGASASLSHAWNYNANNLPGRLFRSAYDGNVQLNYRQPVWAGSGTEYTRIAGPIGDNIVGLSGVNQGVVIARINTDITLVDFEAQVRNMLKDVEDIYWDLYLAYRTYDSQVVARNSALASWRKVSALMAEGSKGGDAADEAQSREAYFDARSRAEDALGATQTEGLYALELRLRRICGLPVNDGRIIRPKDEPSTAEFQPDWHVSLAEALTRREELRRQKWNIKSLELQLNAANSLANPRLDFVSSYQINGFGDDLIGHNGDQGTNGADFQSAYRSIGRGDQTGYSAGFEFSMPLGLRNAHSQVRNIELRLAKARDVLAQQELEISHELANSFQQLSWRYVTAQTNFNRRVAAAEQLKAFQAKYTFGATTLDLVLQAQSRLAAAEIAFYRSITEYNKALSDLHFRKGTLLEHNNVHLSEGMWTAEAYRDALRKAWARSYSMQPLKGDPLRTEPEPFVNESGYLSGPALNGLGTSPAPMDGYDAGQAVPSPGEAPAGSDEMVPGRLPTEGRLDPDAGAPQPAAPVSPGPVPGAGPTARRMVLPDGGDSSGGE